jgi:hypothetical protein
LCWCFSSFNFYKPSGATGTGTAQMLLIVLMVKLVL